MNFMGCLKTLNSSNGLGFKICQARGRTVALAEKAKVMYLGLSSH